MTSESAVIRVPPVERPAPTLEGRTVAALRVVGAFAGLVAVVMAGGGLPAPMPIPMLVIGATALVSLSWAAASWIEQGRDWARAAATGLLATLIVFGALDALLALGRGTALIPLGAVVALWAFRAARVSTAALTGRSRALIVAYAVTSGTLTLGPPIAAPGGPLTLGEGAIDTSVLADCGAGTGAPERVRVTFRWAWSSSEPFPTAADGIAIAWSEGGEEGFYIDESSIPPDGAVWQGGEGNSAALADQVVSNSGNGITFGVDPAAQGFGPGSVAITLVGPRSRPEHGALDIVASYVHAGVWRSIARTRCSW